MSPRIAPQLAGVGLIEAIPEWQILAKVQRQAVRPGPVKGQANRVWDAYTGRTMIGRFGWKANVATLAHQSAGAFLGDIGITSSRFPKEACTQAQPDCLAAAARGGMRQLPCALLSHRAATPSRLQQSPAGRPADLALHRPAAA